MTTALGERPARAHLRSREARWLFFEKEEAPLHRAFVVELDERIEIDALREHVAARLHRVPHSRARIETGPFGGTLPSWRRDPDFDLGRHVRCAELGEGASCADLVDRASSLLSPLLERDKPLWELHLLNGAERSLVVVKVHRAVLAAAQRTGGQGIPASGWLEMLFASMPESVAPPGKAELGQESAEDGFADRVVDRSLEAMEAWSRWSMSAVDAAHGWLTDRSFTAWESLLVTMPDFGSPIRSLPFNRRGDGESLLESVAIPMSEARSIRRRLYGTIDDLVLNLVAGAVGRYVRSRGPLPKSRSLRVLMRVPLSPRSSSDRSGMSALPVNLPLDVEDPLARHRAIRETTRLLRSAKVADAMDRSASLFSIVPPPVQALAGRAYRGRGPAEFHLPLETGSGSQIPLYLAGARATSIVPYIPTAYRSGLTCAAFSYNQRLFLGLAGGRISCPDLADLRAALESELVVLKDRLGVADMKTIETS